MKRFVAAAVLAAGLGVAVPAQAAYLITASEVGPDVVFSGSGSFNLSALTFYFSSVENPAVRPDGPALGLGASGPNDFYTGFLALAVPFGPGSGLYADFGSGPIVGYNDFVLLVPKGYVSGTLLGVSTATFSNATFASLGITPGTYVTNWGRGASADSLTLTISASVPEPASWAMMVLGIGAIGAISRRRVRTTSVRFAA